MVDDVTAESEAPQAPVSRFIATWARYLSDPIDGASIAVFRMWFGLCLLVNVWAYADTIELYYLVPKFNFSFVPGLHPWPGYGMFIHFCVMAIAAGGIALGYYYRPAMVLYFLAQLYLFLLDKSYYQNHFYLICLLSFLFCFIPAQRVWSVDARNKQMPPLVPRWTVLILRAQFVLVYVYAGVAKICSDWLHGEPQTTYLKEMPPDAIFGTLFSQPWFAQLMTYGGLAFDLSIGFLLLWRRTFWLAAIAAVSFHFLNSRLFEIGIFPWLMMGTIGLFAPPDWPRRVLSRFGVLSATIKDGLAAANYGDLFKWDSKKNIALLSFLHLYSLAQLLIPLRHFLYPGDINWTEQGHRFSWQMMLRVKLPEVFEINIRDRKTGADIPFDVTKILTEKQFLEMQMRPDMILQFAHYLADSYQQQTGSRPIVNVRARESLNMNPPQELIDPTVDLGSQLDSLLPAKWILPYDRSKDFQRSESAPKGR